MRTCGVCGAPVVGHQGLRYCPDHAGEEAARRRRQRYEETHRERIRILQAAWRAKPSGRAYKAAKRSEYRFGGLRDAVLERDGYRCVKCGLPWVPGSRRIVVHHKDFDHTHNTLDNLITLCRTCHPKEHAKHAA